MIKTYTVVLEIIQQESIAICVHECVKGNCKVIRRKSL